MFLNPHWGKQWSLSKIDIEYRIVNDTQNLLHVCELWSSVPVHITYVCTTPWMYAVLFNGKCVVLSNKRLYSIVLYISWPICLQQVKQLTMRLYTWIFKFCRFTHPRESWRVLLWLFQTQLFTELFICDF